MGPRPDLGMCVEGTRAYPADGALSSTLSTPESWAPSAQPDRLVCVCSSMAFSASAMPYMPRTVYFQGFSSPQRKPCTPKAVDRPPAPSHRLPAVCSPSLRGLPAPHGPRDGATRGRSRVRVSAGHRGFRVRVTAAVLRLSDGSGREALSCRLSSVPGVCRADAGVLPSHQARRHCGGLVHSGRHAERRGLGVAGSGPPA